MSRGGAPRAWANALIWITQARTEIDRKTPWTQLSAEAREVALDISARLGAIERDFSAAVRHGFLAGGGKGVVAREGAPPAPSASAPRRNDHAGRTTSQRHEPGDGHEGRFPHPEDRT